MDFVKNLDDHFKLQNLIDKETLRKYIFVSSLSSSVPLSSYIIRILETIAFAASFYFAQIEENVTKKSNFFGAEKTIIIL